MRSRHHGAGRVPTPPAGRVAAPLGHTAPGLPEERIRELRKRIREGVYDAEEVAGVVARRILAEGGP